MFNIKHLLTININHPSVTHLLTIENQSLNNASLDLLGFKDGSCPGAMLPHVFGVSRAVPRRSVPSWLQRRSRTVKQRTKSGKRPGLRGGGCVAPGAVWAQLCVWWPSLLHSWIIVGLSNVKSVASKQQGFAGWHFPRLSEGITRACCWQCLRKHGSISHDPQRQWAPNCCWSLFEITLTMWTPTPRRRNEFIEIGNSKVMIHNFMKWRFINSIQ